MQPRRPIIGDDAVVFIDRVAGYTKIQFDWQNIAIFTEVDVFLVIDDKVKKLVTKNNYIEDGIPAGAVTPETEPDGRKVVNPGDTYTVVYYFTKQKHVDPYKKKYPVFKFRIEMVGNRSIFAETNEFKVVY